jgi:hypothetical protein
LQNNPVGAVEPARLRSFDFEGQRQKIAASQARQLLRSSYAAPAGNHRKIERPPLRPSVAEIPDKTLIVISPAVSCPGFVKARIYQIYQQTLRGARNMHEIPNLPFPSLHETEQTTTQQAGAQQPEPKEASDSRKADSED